MPREGSVVAGRYRLVTLLGQGGFGEVWIAEVCDTPRTVALKFLCQDLRAEAVTRFKAEFALMTQLAHPHINTVYDFDRDAVFGYFFTAALVHGSSCVKALRDATVDQIEQVGVQILRALAYLHRHGIYHFDIKPANLLVSARGHDEWGVMLIDFGLASLHPERRMIGTPSYMAPECFLDHPVDGRADLYALGVVLYACLTHRNPFRALTVEDARAVHLQVMPPPPSAWRPDVPSYLDTIVMRLLAKAPADRYASAYHVLRELQVLSPHRHPIEAKETMQAYVPTAGTMIGRHAAQAWLRTWLATASHATPLCVIEGESGMGKSTLLRWLKFTAQIQDWKVVAWWGFEETPPESFARDLAHCLTAAQGTAKTVIVIDDVDQLLDASRAPAISSLLSTVMTAVHDHGLPGVRLCLAGRAVSLPFSPTAMHRITVGPFAASDVGEYLSAVAPIPAAQRAALVSVLMRKTGGCPAVVAATVTQLVQTDQLIDASGQWETSQFEDITVDVAEVDVPRAIWRAVEQRVASISAVVRPLCECLAAWEEASPLPGLCAVVADPAVPQHLATLVAQGWLHYDGQGERYFFADPLVPQVLLSQLTAAARARWHVTIADYLQTIHAPETTIDHHRTFSDDPAVAYAALCRCSEFERYHGQLTRAMRRVRDFLHRTLADDHRLALLLRLAQLELQADQYEASWSHAQEVLTLVGAHDERRYEAIEHLGKVAVRQQQAAKARLLVDEAVTALAKDGSAPVWSIRLRNLAARIQMAEGHLVQACEAYREGWAQQRQLPPEVRHTIDNNELGQSLLLQGKSKEVVAHVREELEILDAEQSPLAVASRCSVLATALRHVGEHRAAIRALKRAIALARQGQDLRLLAVLYNGLGTVLAEQGKTEEAVQSLERAVPLCYRTGDLPSAVTIGLNIGHLHIRLGHVQAADYQLRAALAAAEGTLHAETRHLRCSIAQLLGELARRRQAWEVAGRYLDEAWVLAETDTQLAHYRFIIQLTRAEVAHDQGKVDERRRWLAEAVTHPHTDAEEREYQRLVAASASDRC